MAQNEDRVGNGVRIGLLVFLGIATLVVLAPGLVVYQSVYDDWSSDPRGFHDIDGAVNWLFGIAASAAVAVGLILIGVMLRLIRWKRAPLLSLALAVLSTGFIIATYLIFSDDQTPNSIEVVFLQGCCIVFLLLVALPPFLHWALAKPNALPPPMEPRP